MYKKFLPVSIFQQGTKVLILGDVCMLQTFCTDRDQKWHRVCIEVYVAYILTEKVQKWHTVEGGVYVAYNFTERETKSDTQYIERYMLHTILQRERETKSDTQYIEKYMLHKNL